MKNSEVLTTLFVGIDVSSKSNVVYAMDFFSSRLLSCTVSNNRPGAEELSQRLAALLAKSSFQKVVFALESTSFYSSHIATFLSSDSYLMPYHPYVYCLNPKTVAGYRKSFVDLPKTDASDSFLLADFARVGRIDSQPWRGAQYLALQRLTRHRLHLVECLTREKTYMVSNIFLKFSELSVLKKEEHPFCSNHTATAESVLLEFYSPEEILHLSTDELVAFLCRKSRNRFAQPDKVADILRKAARDSYRLDQCMYEPLTVSIASSFNCIAAFEKEIKSIDSAIEKGIKGLNTNEYQCLLSIPGIGPVFAAGILSEIGSISAFRSQEALAKYAGLVWKRNQSGDYTAENARLSKAGNSYLRYYLIEAASSVSRHLPEYADFYQKKYDEVKIHQHKRALALTARKFVRLIYGLLAKDQLYSARRVEKTS